MSKFERGDRVRIREDFDTRRFTGDPGIVDEMLKNKNQECVIASVLGEKIYQMKNIPWTWYEDWLEYIDEFPINNIDESEILSILE